MKSNYGNVFGGYTSKDWNSLNLAYKDRDSFLFSLTSKEKLEAKNNECGIGGKKDLLCIFGNNYLTNKIVFPDLAIFG